jgi:hypothetical protein
MRTGLLGAALALLVVAGANADEKVAKGAEGAKGGLVHVVIFRMKKDAPKEAVDEAIKDCHAMLAKISAVRSVRAGRPAKGGTRDLAKKDYDFGLLVLVDDADGLQSYLKDPQHLAFVKKHGKHFDMEKIRIFDFMNQK